MSVSDEVSTLLRNEVHVVVSVLGVRREVAVARAMFDDGPALATLLQRMLGDVDEAHREGQR